MFLFQRIPRWVVWGVLSIFISSDIGHSAVGALSLNEVRLDAIQLASFKPYVSGDIGKVDYVHAGQGPTLFHIQTAHANERAQKNTEQILTELKTKYNVKHVFVEGSSGALHSELLQLFVDDQQSNQQVLDQLISDGLVKGPDSFLVNHQGTEGFGIENLDGYVSNRKQLIHLKILHRRNEREINQIATSIEALKATYFKDDLLDFVSEKIKYETRLDSFQTWLKVLSQYALNRLNVDLQSPAFQFDWPMLTRYFKLQQIESVIDLNAFDKEKLLFAKSIQPFLKKQKHLLSALNDYLDLGMFQKGPSLSEQEHLVETMLENLPQNFAWQSYPQVKAYIAYRLINEELDLNPLIEEMVTLEREILTSYMLSEIQNEILFLIESWISYRKLFSQDLSKDDLRKVKTLPLMKDWLKQLKEKSEVSASDEKALVKLYQEAMRFYLGAEERDHQMIENLMRNLTKNHIKKAVVVTGGFHVDAFKKHFSARNFNYALISPKMMEMDEEKDKKIYERNLFQKATLETSSPLLLPRDIRAHGSDPSFELELVLRRAFGVLRRDNYDDLITRLNSSAHARAFGYHFEAGFQERQTELMQVINKYRRTLAPPSLSRSELRTDTEYVLLKKDGFVRQGKSSFDEFLRRRKDFERREWTATQKAQFIEKMDALVFALKPNSYLLKRWARKKEELQTTKIYSMDAIEISEDDYVRAYFDPTAKQLFLSDKSLNQWDKAILKEILYPSQVIALVGASSAIGQDIFKSLRHIYPKVLGTFYHGWSFGESSPLDIRDEEAVKEFLVREKPDVVVYASGESNPERAEKDMDEARRLNVEGPRFFSKYHQGKLVYLSSDYVFDGQNGPYSLEDVAAPVNAYGQTKYEGEQVARSHEDHAVVRLGVAYGDTFEGDRNFIRTVIKALEKGQVLELDDEQIRRPTWVRDVSDTVIEAIDGDVGIYQINGGESLTKYEWGLEIARVYFELYPHRFSTENSQDIISAVIKAKVPSVEAPTVIRPKDAGMINSFSPRKLEVVLKKMIPKYSNYRKQLYEKMYLALQEKDTARMESLLQEVESEGLQWKLVSDHETRKARSHQEFYKLFQGNEFSMEERDQVFESMFGEIKSSSSETRRYAYKNFMSLLLSLDEMKEQIIIFGEGKTQKSKHIEIVGVNSKYGQREIIYHTLSGYMHAPEQQQRNVIYHLDFYDVIEAEDNYPIRERLQGGSYSTVDRLTHEDGRTTVEKRAKKSDDGGKLLAEARMMKEYYDQDDPRAALYPEIYSIIEDGDEVIVSMEDLSGVSLTSASTWIWTLNDFVKGTGQGGFLNEEDKSPFDLSLAIYRNLAPFYYNKKAADTPDDFLEKFHFGKLHQRWQETAEKSETFKQLYQAPYIDMHYDWRSPGKNLLFPNLRTMTRLLQLITTFHKETFLPPYLAEQHGDLHYGNILIDPFELARTGQFENLKLIDPNSILNDPLYDFAKIMHNNLGWYDMLIKFPDVYYHDIVAGESGLTSAVQLHEAFWDDEMVGVTAAMTRNEDFQRDFFTFLSEQANATAENPFTFEKDSNWMIRLLFTHATLIAGLMPYHVEGKYGDHKLSVLYENALQQLFMVTSSLMSANFIKFYQDIHESWQSMEEAQTKGDEVAFNLAIAKLDAAIERTEKFLSLPYFKDFSNDAIVGKNEEKRSELRMNSEHEIFYQDVSNAIDLRQGDQLKILLEQARVKGINWVFFENDEWNGWSGWRPQSFSVDHVEAAFASLTKNVTFNFDPDSIFPESAEGMTRSTFEALMLDVEEVPRGIVFLSEHGTYENYRSLELTASSLPQFSASRSYMLLHNFGVSRSFGGDRQFYWIPNDGTANATNQEPRKVPLAGGSYSSISRLLYPDGRREIEKRALLAKDKGKLAAEARYMRSFYEDGDVASQWFPKIESIEDVDGETVVVMEDIGEPTFSDAIATWVHQGDLPFGSSAFPYAVEIYEQLTPSFYSQKQSETPDDFLERYHFEKVEQRWNDAIEIAPIMETILNAPYTKLRMNEDENYLYPNMRLMLELLRILTHQHPNIFKPPFMSKQHGDLHFDNILIDRFEFLREHTISNFKLLDPKYLPEGNDPLYDFAKLMHSYYGRYDLMLAYHPHYFFPITFPEEAGDPLVLREYFSDETSGLLEMYNHSSSFENDLMNFLDSGKLQELLDFQPVTKHPELRFLFTHATLLASLFPYHLEVAEDELRVDEQSMRLFHLQFNSAGNLDDEEVIALAKAHHVATTREQKGSFLYRYVIQEFWRVLDEIYKNGLMKTDSNLHETWGLLRENYKNGDEAQFLESLSRLEDFAEKKTMWRRSELRSRLIHEKTLYPHAGLKGLAPDEADVFILKVPDHLNIEAKVWDQRTSRPFNAEELQRFETGEGLSDPSSFDLSFEDVAEVRTTIYDRSTGSIKVKVVVETKTGEMQYLDLDGFDTTAMKKLKDLMPPMTSMVDHDSVLQVSAGNQGDLQGNLTIVSEDNERWRLFSAVDELWNNKAYPAFVQLKDGQRLLGKVSLHGNPSTNELNQIMLTTEAGEIVELQPSETNSILVAYVLGWGETNVKDLLKTQYNKTSDLRHIFGFPRYEDENPSMLFYDQLLENDENIARAFEGKSIAFELKDNYGGRLTYDEVLSAFNQYGYVRKSVLSEVKNPGDYYLADDKNIHLIFHPAVYPLNSLVVSRDGKQSAFVTVKGMSGKLGANYWEVFEWVKQQLPWAYALFALDNGMDPSWRRFEQGRLVENIIDGRDRVNASLTLRPRSELRTEDEQLSEREVIPQFRGIIRAQLIAEESKLFKRIRKIQEIIMAEMPGVFTRVEKPHLSLASRIARRERPLDRDEIQKAIEKDESLNYLLPTGLIATPEQFHVSLTGGVKINLSVNHAAKLDEWRKKSGDKKKRVNHYTLLRPKFKLSQAEKAQVEKILARIKIEQIPSMPIDHSELIHYEDVAFQKIHPIKKAVVKTRAENQREKIINYLEEGVELIGNGSYTFAFKHPLVKGQVILVKRSSLIVDQRVDSWIVGPQISEAEERNVYRILSGVGMVPKTFDIGQVSMFDIQLKDAQKRSKKHFDLDLRKLKKLQGKRSSKEFEVKVLLQEEGIPLDRYALERPEHKELAAKSLAKFTQQLWRMGLIDLEIARRNYMLAMNSEGEPLIGEDGLFEVRLLDFGAVMPLPDDVLNFLKETHEGSDIPRGWHLQMNLREAIRTSRILFPKLDLADVQKIANDAFQTSQSVSREGGDPKEAYLEVLNLEKNQKVILRYIDYIARRIKRIGAVESHENENSVSEAEPAQSPEPKKLETSKLSNPSENAESQLQDNVRVSRSISKQTKEFLSALSAFTSLSLFYAFAESLGVKTAILFSVLPSFILGYLMVTKAFDFARFIKVKALLQKGSKYQAHGSYTHVLSHPKLKKELILIKRNSLIVMQRLQSVIRSPQISEEEEWAIYRFLRRHGMAPQTKFVGRFVLNDVHPDWAGVSGEEVLKLDQKRMASLAKSVSKAKRKSSVYLQKEGLPLNQYVKNHPDKKTLIAESLASFTRKLWGLGFVDLDIGRRNYLIKTNALGKAVLNNEGLLELEMHDFGAVMAIPEDLEEFFKTKHPQSDITRGFFFLRNLTATSREAKILFPGINLKQMKEIIKVADASSELAKKKGQEGLFKEAYLRVLELPEHQELIENLSAQIANEITRSRSELRSFNDSPDARYWIGRSLRSLHPGQVVWQPTRSEYKDDPWDEAVEGLAGEDDPARMLIEAAYEYLFKIAERSKSQGLVNRIKALLRYTTVVSTDIPTYFYFSNAEEKFADPSRISFSQRSIFFSKKLLELWGQEFQALAERDRELRVMMIALYINRALHVLETFYRMEEAGYSVKDIHDKIQDLIQDEDFKDKDLIRGDFKEADIDALIFPLSYDDVGTNYIRHKELEDSEGSLMRTAGELENLLAVAIEERRSIYDDPELARENFLEVAKALEILALHIDSTGDHNGAVRIYKRALQMYHLQQRVDPKALGPYQVEAQVLVFLLRAGMLKEFLVELKTFLTGEGFPDPADQADMDALNEMGNVSGADHVAPWLLQHGPKLLYALQVYTSILQNEDRRKVAEATLVESERMIMEYWNDFARNDSNNRKTIFDIDTRRLHAEKTERWLPIVGVLSAINARYTKQEVGEQTELKVDFLYQENRRLSELLLGVLKFKIIDDVAIIDNYSEDVSMKALSTIRFTNLKRALIASAIRLAKASGAKRIEIFDEEYDGEIPLSLKVLGFSTVKTGHWRFDELDQQARQNFELTIQAKERSELRSDEKDLVASYRSVFASSQRDELIAKILKDVGFSFTRRTGLEETNEFKLSPEGYDFFMEIIKGRFKDEKIELDSRAQLVTKSLDEIKVQSLFLRKSPEILHVEDIEGHRVPFAITFKSKDEKHFFVVNLMDFFISERVSGNLYENFQTDVENMNEDIFQRLANDAEFGYGLAFRIYTGKFEGEQFKSWESMAERSPKLFGEEDFLVETLDIEIVGENSDLLFSSRDHFSLDFQSFLYEMNKEMPNLFGGKHVHEIGVGTGVNLHHLNQFGASKITSSDMMAPYVLFSDWNRVLGARRGGQRSGIAKPYLFAGLDQRQSADVIIMNAPAVVSDDESRNSIIQNSRGIKRGQFIKLFDSLKDYLLSNPEASLILRIQPGLQSGLTGLSALDALSMAGNDARQALEMTMSDFLAEHPEIQVVKKKKDLYLLKATRSELRTVIDASRGTKNEISVESLREMFGEFRFEKTVLQVLNDFGEFGNYDRANQKDYLAFKVSAKGRRILETLFKSLHPDETISFSGQGKLITTDLETLKRRSLLVRVGLEKFNLKGPNAKGAYRIPLSLLFTYQGNKRAVSIDLSQLFYADDLKDSEYHFLDSALQSIYEDQLVRVNIDKENSDGIELRRLYGINKSDGRFKSWVYFLDYRTPEEIAAGQGVQVLSLGDRKPYSDIVFEPIDEFSLDFQSFLNERYQSDPKLFEGRSVLEIGSGTGVNINHFKRFGVSDVTLVDLSETYTTLTHWNKIFMDELNPTQASQAPSVVHLDSGIPDNVEADVIVFNMPQIASAERMAKKAGGIVTSSRGISVEDFKSVFDQIAKYLVEHSEADAFLRLNSELHSGLVDLSDTVIDKMDEYAALDLLMSVFLRSYPEIEVVRRKADLYHLRAKRSELRTVEWDVRLLEKIVTLRDGLLPLSWFVKVEPRILFDWLADYLDVEIYSKSFDVYVTEENRILLRPEESRLADGKSFDRWQSQQTSGALVLGPEWSKRILNEPEVLYEFLRFNFERQQSLSAHPQKALLTLVSDEITEETVLRALERKNTLTGEQRYWLRTEILSHLTRWIKVIKPSVFRQNREEFLKEHHYAVSYLNVGFDDESFFGKYPAQFVWDPAKMHANDNEWIHYLFLGLLKTATLLKDVANISEQIRILETSLPEVLPGASRAQHGFSFEIEDFAEDLISRQIVEMSA